MGQQAQDPPAFDSRTEPAAGHSANPQFGRTARYAGRAASREPSRDCLPPGGGRADVTRRGDLCRHRARLCSSVRATKEIPDGLALAGANPARLQEALVGSRCRGRAGALLAARPPGDGLRRARGTARCHGPVHLHPVPDRVRPGRAVAHPGPRAGLRARADDRRGDHPPGGRRRGPGAGDPDRLRTSGGHRRDHDRRRGRQPRVRRRPAVQAHDPGLHERPGPDDPRGPTAQAAGLLDRRGQLPGRGQGRGHRHHRR